MKRVVLFLCIILLQNDALTAQDSAKIYLGLYTAGTIEQYSKRITDPYYKNLNYYTLSLIPKAGIQFKHMTVGVMGGYTFHKNTFESNESIWGGGYFLKYNLLQKHATKVRNRTIRFDYFFEWRHLVNDGYYIPIADWRRAKVSTPVTYLTLQAGMDFRWSPSWSIALGTGVGSSNFLKDSQDFNSGRRIQIRPYGTLTLQYHIKL